MVKACEHYKLKFGEKTYILPSHGHLWNAWVECYDERGNLVYNSFRTGLYAEYFEHLLQSRKCRRQANITKREVMRMLRKIEREWKEVVGT